MKKTDAFSLALLLGGNLDWILRKENFDISGFAPVEYANVGDVSFFLGPSVTGVLRNSHTDLLLVPMNFLGRPPFVGALLRVENPYLAMVKVIDHFHKPFVEYPKTSVSSTAKVHPSAVVEGIVEDDAVVGPGSVVMQGAILGAGSVLEANDVLYPGVVVGKNCIFQAGVVVGSRGFGFYFDHGRRLPVPHVSGVKIGNNCSFGANMVVASGFLAPTVIGNDCHFDSFVQIGHNCTVGNGIYMASQSGLGGSTVVEDFVEFAGGAQIAGHLTIGAGAHVAAKAGVTKSIPPGVTFAGFPAEPIERWRKGVILLRRMAEED
ncbi:MAG: UDP-3-O-(3-hydroxymyristoyl)glucosamine N-acyltransferase [Fibrobacteraceae bacterium]|nr:UDP-3-O-(3-hydroxymyristoyl)glucosamine N-acyltransferase [Fibrobacteraceae bacterium]